MHEGPTPEIGGLCALDEDRLLLTASGPTGYISEDAGITWSDSFRFMQNGRPFDGTPMKVGITRLNTGDLGIAYMRDKLHAGPTPYTTRGFYYASSSDDGRNWTEGTPMLPTDFVVEPGSGSLLWGNFTQLSTGRLIASAYWSFSGMNTEIPPSTEYPVAARVGELVFRGYTGAADGHTYEAVMGGCYTHYSDDMGKTWFRSTGSIMVWPLPNERNEGGFSGAFEPVVIELKDGRVMMLVRTSVGRIFQSFSEDGGDHWSLATPTALASGDVPCWLGRLKSTGDLLVVWNQSSTREIEQGYSRGRLSAAVSRDEGESWEHYRTVELSGALEDVKRTELPPVKHVRAQPDLEWPMSHTQSHYPQTAFVQGKVVIKYTHGRISEYDGDYRDGSWFKQNKLKVLPEEWFYT